MGIGVDKLVNQNENLLILSFCQRPSFSCIRALCIQELATFRYFVCLNASISNANASIGRRARSFYYLAGLDLHSPVGNDCRQCSAADCSSNASVQGLAAAAPTRVSVSPALMDRARSPIASIIIIIIRGQ